MKNIYASIASMALTVTSYSLDTGETWPFVTIPHFELRGEQLLGLSGAKYISMGVLVNESDKEQWHNYSVANQGWVQQGLDVQGNGAIASDIAPYIQYRGSGAEHDGEGGYDTNVNYFPDEGPADPYYGVVWQMAPARESPTLVNFNAMSTRFSDLVERMEATRGEVLSGIVVSEEDTFFELVDGATDTSESYLVQPIFRDVSRADGNSDLVGYLTALLPWENYFKNIIPDGTAPLHLVLKNTCGQASTYEIRGSEVILLSATEDVHDPRFEELVVSAHFNADDHDDTTGSSCNEEVHEGMDHGSDMGMDHGTDTMSMMEDDEMMMSNETMTMDGGGNRSRRQLAQDGDGTHGDHETSSNGCNGEALVHTAETHDILSQQELFFCWYVFSIYPTQEFSDSMTSKVPIYITFGVVAIFLITSLVFWGYNILVTRRQSKVEKHAAKSDAIVSSLFPEQVRQRLMENNSKTKGDKSNSASTQNAVTNFAGQVVPVSSDHDLRVRSNFDLDDSANVLLQTKPIADLFPSASVLFADICGFTAWSSTREPSQTFTLLEQIYNAFDVIARRRRIFKVETIGDCYVAAAGLPEPLPDHAVAMSRFATECLSKMVSVVQRLEVLLGPGTADLSMRFGIHRYVIQAFPQNGVTIF
jgi:hypothetical protein